ncbi:MAG: patatin-like phospholipase family protein [Reichenbachiella sp.]
MNKKTVSLVLGSGGARGMAHIGIIRWLEENGYEIKSISGCSIGSVIGGVYATNTMDDFVNWIKDFDKSDVLSMLDFAFARDGFVKGDKMLDALKEIVGNGNIEDLPLKFTAVAADIVSEKEVWLDKGPLVEAIRASVSLPLFFTPYELNGVQLVDGGILNPTPIEPTLGDDTDLTIAVNLGGLPVIEPEEEEPKNLFQRKFDEFMDKAQFTKNKKSEWDMLYIADQSFNTMQNRIAFEKMQKNPPDVCIDVPRNKCGTLEFEKAPEMIEYGYNLAELHVDI